jgi:hypothetical protein
VKTSNALVPIFVPTFNNPTLLRGMLDQLLGRGFASVTVLDNASTFPPMLTLLDEVADRVHVHRFRTNRGPAAILNDTRLWNSLPRVFCLTDPDLKFHQEMPEDFVDRLYELSEKFCKGKVGLALDISDPSILRDDDFVIDGGTYKIWEWEAQFWVHEVESDVYKAQVDTTFALYNKAFHDPSRHLDALRVGGTFTCEHLPWRRDFALPRDELEFYQSLNRHSFYIPNVRTGAPRDESLPVRAARQLARTARDSWARRP